MFEQETECAMISVFAYLPSSLESFPQGAAPAGRMELGQDRVTSKHLANPCIMKITFDSFKLSLWNVQLYLIWLLSSLSTCRFLNCRMQRGTSPRRLLSNRSSASERYVPTKETRSMPSLIKALWDRRRDCRLDRM